MARNRIQRFTTTLTLDFAADDNQIISGALSFNGLLHGILLNTPNLDNTDTTTITIKDADGNTMFSRASLVESTKHVITEDSNNHPLRIPLAGAHTIQLDTSGAQAADKDFDIVLLIARGF